MTHLFSRSKKADGGSRMAAEVVGTNDASASRGLSSFQNFTSKSASLLKSTKSFMSPEAASAYWPVMSVSPILAGGHSSKGTPSMIGIIVLPISAASAISNPQFLLFMYFGETTEMITSAFATPLLIESRVHSPMP